MWITFYPFVKPHKKDMFIKLSYLSTTYPHFMWIIPYNRNCLIQPKYEVYRKSCKTLQKRYPQVWITVWISRINSIKKTSIRRISIHTPVNNSKKENKKW